MIVIKSHQILEKIKENNKNVIFSFLLLLAYHYRKFRSNSCRKMHATIELLLQSQESIYGCSVKDLKVPLQQAQLPEQLHKLFYTYFNPPFINYKKTNRVNKPLCSY